MFLLRILAAAEPQTATYFFREFSNIHHDMLVPHLDQDRQEEFRIELHKIANLYFLYNFTELFQKAFNMQWFPVWTKRGNVYRIV